MQLNEGGDMRLEAWRVAPSLYYLCIFATYNVVPARIESVCLAFASEKSPWDKIDMCEFPVRGRKEKLADGMS